MNVSRLATVTALLSLLAIPASAQIPQGYVAGFVGGTFGTSAAAPVFGAEVAKGVAPNLSIYGTFGRMQDITPKEATDALDVASALLTLTTGDRWEFTAKSPAWFGIVGLKGYIPTQGNAKPYVAGGVGFASVSATIEEVDLGDITTELALISGIDPDDFDDSGFMSDLGAGVEIQVGESAMVDVGYRFHRFAGVNISRVFGSIGLRFP